MANQSAQEFFGNTPTSNLPQTQAPQPAAPGVTDSQSADQFFNDQGGQPQEPGFFSNLSHGNLVGAAKNVMDFAFPIISDLGNDINGTSQKSVMQQIGDAGLSALWFIPGFGEAGEAALGAGRLAAEGAGQIAAHAAEGAAVKGAGEIAAHAAPSVVGNIVKGAGIGYVGDVSAKLASGDTNAASVLTPGFGTVTGGIAGSVFPKLSKMLGQNFTQEGALQAAQDNMTSAFKGTKAGVKYLTDAAASGHNPMELLANEMAIPDIIDTKFDTTAAQKIVQNNIDKLSQFRAKALDEMSTAGTDAAAGVFPPSIDEFKQELIGAAQKQFKGTAQQNIVDHLNNEFDAYAQQFGDNPTVSDWEKIKEDFYSKSNYDATRPGIVTQANKMAGAHAKQLIENLSEKAGFPQMGEYNKLIAQHYTALDGLKLLNGNTIKGGRLGNLLRGHTVAGVSAVAGSALGGGFLGTLAAGAAGEAGSALYSRILGDMSLVNPWQERLLNKIASENPEVVQKLQSMLGATGELAPQLAPKASEGLNKAATFATKAAASGAAQAANPAKPNANRHTPGQVVKGGDGNSYLVNDKGNYVLVQ